MMRFLEVEHISVCHVPSVWVKMRQGGQSNRHWRDVLWQNVEIIRAARRMGLPFNALKFITAKVASRALQRWNA
jgi:hypothetical protein